MSLAILPLRVGPEEVLLGEVPVAITEQRLRDALAGRDRVVTRARAVALLGVTDLGDKVQLLEVVLQDVSAEPDIQRMAAIQLGYIDRPESRKALLRALGERDTRVLGGIVKALGWIGAPDAYEPLLSIHRRASDTLAEQAEFAARLIAHRHGLAGAELPPLRLPAALEVNTVSQLPGELVPAPPEKARRCFESITSRSFSLRFDQNRVYQLRCQQNECILLFHSDIARLGSHLLQRRSIPAAMAIWIEETGSYSIASLVLFEAAAEAKSNRVIVYRSSGQPICAGQARLEGDRLFVSIRALTRPGAFPLLFEGTLRSGELAEHRISSGPVVVPKNRPLPM